MRKLFLARICAAIAGLVLTASLAGAAVNIGDPAPKLQTGKWVQGEPVDQFDTNHVYVVEFWATWCGPCRATIPHLNELSEKFTDKGVIFIGQDVWDSDRAVAPFVKSMGTQMTYRVVLDDKRRDPEGFMASHWWKRGVDRHGIPNAFVIDRQGRVAWIGHPAGLDESLLGNILEGRYDLKQAAVEYQKREQDNEQWARLNGRLNKAVAQKRWTEAGPALDDLLRQAPALGLRPAVEDGYAGIRLRILLGQKKYDEAYRFAVAFSDAHPNDVGRQNDLAWTLVTESGIEQPNLRVAKKLVERANAATQGKDPAILDTLARVLFMDGDRAGAIEAEQKALDAAPEPERDRYRACLADYRHGTLPEVKE